MAVVDYAVVATSVFSRRGRRTWAAECEYEDHGQSWARQSHRAAETHRCGSSGADPGHRSPSVGS